MYIFMKLIVSCHLFVLHLKTSSFVNFAYFSYYCCCFCSIKNMLCFYYCDMNMTTTVITLISVSVSFKGIVWLHKTFESLLWCLFCHFRAWKPSFLIHLQVENGRIILQKFTMWVPQKKRDFNLGNKRVKGDKFSFWGRRSHTLAMLWPSIHFFLALV